MAKLPTRAGKRTSLFARALENAGNHKWGVSIVAVLAFTCSLILLLLVYIVYVSVQARSSGQKWEGLEFFLGFVFAFGLLTIGVAVLAPISI